MSFLPAKPLALLVTLLLLALACALPAHAARLALVIGNDNYVNLKQPLRNARNDARLMTATLRSAGFEVVGNTRENLSRSEMWRAINQFKDRIGPGDEVVFFFAGHGVQIGANPMLLPVDIEADSADQVDTDGLRLLDVHDKFRAARFALLIIDACRDNPFPPRPGTRSIGDTRGLVPPAREQLATGSAIFMAASTGQRALDRVPGENVANGLFTHELVQALKIPGLDVVSALRQARDNVEDKAKSANHAQRPALVEEMRGGWALFPGARTVPQPVPGFSMEDESWALCRSAATPGPCQAYLDDFAQGRYVRLARTRLADLQPRQMASVVAEPVQTPQPGRLAAPAVGQVLKECAACPEVVVLPGGIFNQGSNVLDSEQPVRRVTITSFAMGRSEVTVAQYLACVAAGGCAEPEWRERGGRYHHEAGSDDHYRRLGPALTAPNNPIVGVSHADAMRYAKWLSAHTNSTYRLPSESEWEYAARAGTNTAYFWGDVVGQGNANCDGCGSRWDNKQTAPVAQFKPNAFGLYDMHGNVWEWTQDVWHPNYRGAPTDGSSWMTAGDQSRRVLRGGSWFNVSQDLRSADRNADAPVDRSGYAGFRVARTF